MEKEDLKILMWKESSEIEENKKDYPLILTTSCFTTFNAATMTRRTKNVNIVSEDILLVHRKMLRKEI